MDSDPILFGLSGREKEGGIVEEREREKLVERILVFKLAIG